MEWYEIIITAGAVIGALSLIASKVNKYFKLISESYNDLQVIKEDNKKQNRAILRLTLMNPEMPISERLIAGKEYVDGGGNGDCAGYYHTLLEEHTK